MDWLHDALAQVGAWFSDDNVKTGAGVVGGAVFATLVGWWRRRREKPERVKVVVDAPPGEKVFVQLGDDDEETRR